MEMFGVSVYPGFDQIMAGQPTPPGPRTPPRNKGLIAGLIKGNQWVFISPDHKGPRLFLGGGATWRLGGVAG